MTVLGVLRECLRFSLTKRKTTKEVALPPSTLCSNARGFSPVIVDKSRIMMRDSYTRVSTEVNPSSASHLFPLGTFSPTVKVVQDKPHPPPKNTPPILDSIRFDSSVDSAPPSPLPRAPLPRSWTSERSWKRTIITPPTKTKNNEHGDM